MKQPEKDRFFKHVDRDGPEIEGYPELGKCWLWMGATTKKGQGIFKLSSGKQMLAHKYLYQLQYGPIHHRLWQMCSISICVNPTHQEMGPTPERLSILAGMKRRAELAKHHQAQVRRREWMDRAGVEEGVDTLSHNTGMDYREPVPKSAKQMQNRERQRWFRAIHNPILKEAVGYEAGEVVRTLKSCISDPGLPPMLKPRLTRLIEQVTALYEPPPPKPRRTSEEVLEGMKEKYRWMSPQGPGEWRAKEALRAKIIQKEGKLAAKRKREGE